MSILIARNMPLEPGLHVRQPGVVASPPHSSFLLVRQCCCLSALLPALTMRAAGFTGIWEHARGLPSALCRTDRGLRAGGQVSGHEGHAILPRRKLSSMLASITMRCPCVQLVCPCLGPPTS